MTFSKLEHAVMTRRDLTASSKLVFAAIQDRIGSNGECWPGVRRLASDTGLTVETVIQSITLLERAGLVTVDRPGNGKSNHYTIPQSAQRIRALGKPKRTGNPSTGAQKT